MAQEDITMGEDPPLTLREPFTVEENILQLNAIDKSMVQLMHHTATALSALTTPASSSSSSSSSSSLTSPPRGVQDPISEQPPSSTVDPEAQKEAFRAATDTFLSTLHTIDVRMKRQILALEEAGIVDLSNAQRQESGAVVNKASLRPNGLGNVGNLDVGRLNSRGTKVERDMELELWDKAKRLLEREL